MTPLPTIPTLWLRGIATLCLLAGVGLSRGDDRRTDPTSLTLMSFNAEFLWDGVEPEEGSADFPWKGSQTEAEEHMANVAAVIIQANPDIVNLVEVENLGTLDLFNSKFLAGRGYRPYLVKGLDIATGQDVGLLTRIDPENNAIERDNRNGQSGGTAKSVSKNYIAKLQVNGKHLALLGIHLLAIPPDISRKLSREAQADAVRSIAVDLQSQGSLPIVLGDFNDYEDAADAKDHIDSTPITTVLRRIRSMDPDKPADDLKNLAAFVPKSMRYTAFYDENRNGQIDAPMEYTSIDHILVAPALVPTVEHVTILHNHDPRVVSDHFPVVARFRFTPSPPDVLTNQIQKVRIQSLLPNPTGNENLNEQATLVNLGTQPVDLNGWKLRDLAHGTWALDSLSTLAPGASKTLKRNGQPMALNNGGDTIDLLEPSGTVIQTVTYGAAEENELITPANN